MSFGAFAGGIFDGLPRSENEDCFHRCSCLEQGFEEDVIANAVGRYLGLKQQYKYRKM